MVTGCTWDGFDDYEKTIKEDVKAMNKPKRKRKKKEKVGLFINPKK